MRDGWLDEPLKPLLQRLGWQRWREGRLETPILHQAKRIFVTSAVWKDLLENRLHFTRGKTTVLTNGYPPDSLQPKNIRRKHTDSDKIDLLYAGQFRGSRNSRKVQHLLKPLLEGIHLSQAKGEVVLLGNLEVDDLAEVNYWKPQFEEMGWSIVVQSSLPRAELLERLHQADGLLLLSVAPATIPSKLFEYLTARRPILSLTPEGSAVWRVCEGLPQVFLSDYSQPDQMTVVKDFLAACLAKEDHYEIPLDFSEEQLAKTFLQRIRFGCNLDTTLH
jgi:glycosyltransferase involved in cell wall biosynthesis